MSYGSSVWKIVAGPLHKAPAIAVLGGSDVPSLSPTYSEVVSMFRILDLQVTIEQPFCCAKPHSAWTLVVNRKSQNMVLHVKLGKEWEEFGSSFL